MDHVNWAHSKFSDEHESLANAFSARLTHPDIAVESTTTQNIDKTLKGMIVTEYGEMVKIMLCRINYHFRLPSTFPHGDHVNTYTRTSHHINQRTPKVCACFGCFCPKSSSSKAKKSKLDVKEKEGSLKPR